MAKLFVAQAAYTVVVVGITEVDCVVVVAVEVTVAASVVVVVLSVTVVVADGTTVTVLVVVTVTEIVDADAVAVDVDVMTVVEQPLKDGMNDIQWKPEVCCGRPLLLLVVSRLLIGSAPPEPSNDALGKEL